MAKFKVVFDSDVCKGCELCRASCPRGIIEMSAGINSKGYSPASVAREGECVGCASCALVCPDGAIEIFRTEDSE
ncbi:MAG: 4Fe-4S dicluster domain-containing protein [Oscillospiraceae bacterium]|jgi:2-oxoglutarate ferredoxin oxidoreductase subunit delta|nr:4Fe-4S dicluster domain-containing protein [Oscillospiraceae bacterium]